MVVLSRVWHAALALVIAASLVVQIGLLLVHGTDVTTGAENELVSIGTRLVRLFSYFTIQSNLFVLYVALTLFVNPNRDGPVWRVLRLDALLSITITGIVFITVLSDLVVHHSTASIWTNAGFHYVSPVAAVLGWLLFGPRPRITWNVVAWAFVWPVLWTGYTLAHGAFSGWYPYPFLDAAKLGYALALRNVGVVLLIAVAAAMSFKLFDQLILRAGRSAPPASSDASDRDTASR
jgi:hypothetical protein